jgi:hypothetical protein
MISAWTPILYYTQRLPSVHKRKRETVWTFGKIYGDERVHSQSFQIRHCQISSSNDNVYFGSSLCIYKEINTGHCDMYDSGLPFLEKSMGSADFFMSLCETFSLLASHGRA